MKNFVFRLREWEYLFIFVPILKPIEVMEFSKNQLRLLKHILTNVKKEKQINDGTIHLVDGTYYNNSENNGLLNVINKKLKSNE